MTSISFFRKKAAVLLCTDIAAQGLDFPVIHWVVQLDCPETFIELVGRTARYEKDEKTLFLFPSVKVSILEAWLQTKRLTRSIPRKLSRFREKVGRTHFVFCFLFVVFFHPRSRNKTLGSV